MRPYMQTYASPAAKMFPKPDSGIKLANVGDRNRKYTFLFHGSWEMGPTGGILLVIVLLGLANGIKVFVSHEDLKQDYPTGLALKNPPDQRIKDLTMCMRFKFYVLKRTYILTSRPFITR